MAKITAAVDAKPNISQAGRSSSASNLRIIEEDGSITELGNSIAPIQQDLPVYTEEEVAQQPGFQQEPEAFTEVDELSALQIAEEELLGDQSPSTYAGAQADFVSTPRESFAARPVAVGGKQLTSQEAAGLIQEEIAKGQQPRATTMFGLQNTSFTPAQAISVMADIPSASAAPTTYDGYREAIADSARNAIKNTSPATDFTKQSLMKLGVVDPDGQINPIGLESAAYAISEGVLVQKESAREAVKLDFDSEVEAGADAPGIEENVRESGFDSFESPVRIARRATAMQAAAPQAGQAVSPELFQRPNLTKKEAQAAVGYLMRGLNIRGYLDKAQTSKPNAPEYTGGAKLDAVLQSVPELVQHMRGAREKDVTNTPNSLGRSVSERALLYNPRGKTQSKQKLTDPSIPLVARAADYFGTNPNMAAVQTFSIRMGMLDQIMKPGSSALSITKIGNNGQPELVKPFGEEYGPIPLSDHPFASAYQMDVKSFVKSLNGIRQAYNEELVSDSTRDGVRNIIVRARTDPKAKEWLKKAIDIHKAKVYNYVSPNYELGRQVGRVFYFPIELIGVNGRMRIASTTIDLQSNPMYRGLIMPANPVSVSKGSKDMVATKAMIARNFDWSDPDLNVSAEHIAGIPKRAAIFDKLFNVKDKSSTYTANNPSSQPVFQGPNAEFAKKVWNAYQTVRKMYPIKREVSETAHSKGISEDMQQALQMGQAFQTGKQSPDVGFGNNWAGSGANPELSAIQATRTSQAPNLSEGELTNLASVLGTLKANKNNKTKGANPFVDAGKDKEINLKLASLMTLGKIIENKGAFISELTAELDGINSNFGFLALMLGSSKLAKHAGIISDELSQTGVVLTDGDVRDMVSRVSKEIIPQLYPNDTHTRQRIMVDSVQSILDNNFKAKDAWKKPAMVFGYGKLDFLHSDVSEALSELDGIKELIDAQSGGEYTAEEAIDAYSDMAPFVMQRALGEAVSLVELQQEAMKIASALNVEVSFKNPATGFEVNLSDNTYKFIEHQTVIQQPGELGSPSTSLALQETRVVSDPSLRKKNSDGERKGAYVQQGRYSPLAVHSFDAATMMLTAADASKHNSLNDTTSALWFQQAFDATFVDARSYEFVQNSYNKHMTELARNYNPYTELEKLMPIVIDAAAKKGDPEVALSVVANVRHILGYKNASKLNIGFTLEQLNTIEADIVKGIDEKDKLNDQADDAGRQADYATGYYKTNKAESFQKNAQKAMADLRKKADKAGQVDAALMRRLINAWVSNKIYAPREDLKGPIPEIDEFTGTRKQPKGFGKFMENIRKGAAATEASKAELYGKIDAQTNAAIKAARDGGHNGIVFPGGNLQ